MAANPFTFGNPVRDPARSQGRSQEIRQITNCLLSSAQESTSIVGERRISKTSLLAYLSHPDVAPRLGRARTCRAFCPMPRIPLTIGPVCLPRAGCIRPGPALDWLAQAGG